MGDERAGVLLDEKQLGYVVAGGMDALLLPDHIDLYEIFFHEGLVQAIGAVPNVAGRADGRRGLHEIVHGRISNGRNPRVRLLA